MNYTPGPWKYAEDGQIIKKEMFYKPYLIAVARFVSDNKTSTANAQLISAAPDLLEACKACIAAWPYDSNNLSEQKAYSMAEKAITKAEGI